MTLEDLERALVAGDMDLAAAQWLHRTTRETSLDWLHGRKALIEDSLADTAAWPGLKLESATTIGDMIAAAFSCQDALGAPRTFRRHRWVRCESAHIAAETVVCEERARWGDRIAAEAGRLAAGRVALPPLGELSSGMGQREPRITGPTYNMHVAAKSRVIGRGLAKLLEELNSRSDDGLEPTASKNDELGPGLDTFGTESHSERLNRALAEMTATFEPTTPKINEIGPGLNADGVRPDLQNLPNLDELQPEPIGAWQDSLQQKSGELVRLMHSAWNRRALNIRSSIEEVLRWLRSRDASNSADRLWRDPGDRPYGLQEVSTWRGDLLNAYPDAVWSPDRCEAQGDHVAVLWRFHGHHQRSYAGIEPTGRRVRLIGSSVFRLEGGRVVEEDTVLDELALRVQLLTPVFWV